MFLTRSELIELTDRKRPSAQIRWLLKNGYKFEIGASGSPKVLRANVVDRLSESEGRGSQAPNFEVLKRKR